jgi:hypothetical protein
MEPPIVAEKHLSHPAVAEAIDDHVRTDPSTGRKFIRRLHHLNRRRALQEVRRFVVLFQERLDFGS